MIKKFWKKPKQGLFRYLKIYKYYICSMILTFILIFILMNSILAINADFEINEEVNNGSNGSSRVAYNYFLDLSPSMQGFFNENNDSHMHIVSDIFEQISANNGTNRFFWCTNTIEPVLETSTFYQSMKSEIPIVNYYQSMVNNINEEMETNNRDRIIEVIDGLDLSKIFTENYTRVNDSDIDNLNIIVTDMNFLKNENDLENHNQKMENLSVYLGEEIVNSNISIYAITSNYNGIANDESIFSVNPNQSITAIFYLIIFSNNDRGYKNFCQQFEEALTQEGISYSNKFELFNQLYNSEQGLEVDLKKYKSLAMITNQNLNFANGLFKNLASNEFALQLVSEGTSEGILTMPVSEMDLPGYYFSETKGLDDTRIDIEVELYRPIYSLFSFQKNSYETYEDTLMVLYKSAGMYYEDETWYIRIDMNLNTNPNVPKSNSLFQKLLEKARRRYIVMNLKFYMVDPSYLKPSWVYTVGYPQISNVNISTVETVIDKVIQNKENAYHLQSKINRYFGNIVIYILY